MSLHYKVSFKDKVLNKHINEGYSIRRLSKEFKVGRTTIQNWIRSYRLENDIEEGKPLTEDIVFTSTQANPKKQLMKEIEMQMDVMSAFLKELERWDVLD
ncbi:MULTISPECIES: IS630 transposase-related protein [unclassified Fusibacter]|uniref:IS630 transposase-related protein n=1 Tax=unclassified Fusibacter TaxID=2624464 RepID=UPI0013E97291|nr:MULTISPECIES: IS630 transposase-related protein [unclassified Fusibacter]MCK8061720.1 helix-turn-helix domain-containing protein [Fusibacter sp. A2]NPE23908.1 hypothetical protein [Fusibacter sp. A1]